MTGKRQKWMSYYLFITLAFSSIVSFEPSPYDLLMILFVAGGFVLSYFKITWETTLPTIVIFVFLLSNIVSLFFVDKLNDSLLFTGITFYLALTWIGVVAALQYIRLQNIRLIVDGYLVSACFSVIVGILAYLHLIPFSEQYLLFGRVKAFFKDPNVFGPYLVMPALFAISMIEVNGISKLKKRFLKERI